jgi:N-acylneuraminate cytidylyltransferase/CMP-N,N'-diacetyllegionaminic acid synthase
MTYLCTICARGGSKGVPNKNIRNIGGKPLIAHSIEQARSTRLFDKIAVSSDSQDILTVAKTWGADLLIVRPADLASDAAAKLPAIRHCVEEVERTTGQKYDVIVDLDATSPLRTPEDIVGAVKLLETRKSANVITGAPARRSPYFNLVELNEKGNVRLSKPLSRAVTRRQDAPPCFDMNASIYVWQREALFKHDGLFLEDTLLYEMPEARSLDIDSQLDFQIVDFLWRQQHG